MDISADYEKITANVTSPTICFGKVHLLCRKKIWKYATTHNDSAWRLAVVYLCCNIMSVILPLVMRLSLLALIGRNTATSHLSAIIWYSYILLYA